MVSTALSRHCANVGESSLKMNLAKINSKTTVKDQVRARRKLKDFVFLFLLNRKGVSK